MGKAVKKAVKTVRPRGRPTVFSQKVADEICKRLARGETLKAICRDPKMPPDTTVRTWLLNPKRKEFYVQYTKARDIGLEVMAEDLLEISDDGSNDWMESNDPENPGYKFNGEHYQRSRLRVYTRQWYLSKLAPKRYGDRQHIEHSVDEDLAKVIAASRARSGIKG